MEISKKLNELGGLGEYKFIGTNSLEILMQCSQEITDLCTEIEESINLTYHDTGTREKLSLSEISSGTYFLVLFPENSLKFVSNIFSVVTRLISEGEAAYSSLINNIYFIKDEGVFLEKNNSSYEKLVYVSKLIQGLEQLKDHDDSNGYVFWAGGKVLISKEFDEDYFKCFEPKLEKLSELFDEVIKKEHSKEREELFKSSLKRLKDETSTENFTLDFLVKNFNRIDRLWHESFFAFLHDLDFDEMREKVLDRIQKTHENVSNVLSNAQIRILAIPLAIILAFTKVSDQNLSLVVSITITGGLFVLVLAGFILFENTLDDISAVKRRYENWKNEMEYSEFLNEYKAEVKELNKRIDLQEWRVRALYWCYRVFVFFVFIILFPILFSSQSN